MDALISGQAGVAILIAGNTVSSIGIDALRSEIVRPYTSIPYLLDGATDTVYRKSISREGVVTELELAWRRDRALQFTLISLDAKEDDSTRKLAIEYLDEFLHDDLVLQFVMDHLYSVPLPPSASLHDAPVGSSHEEVKRLLFELQADQPHIREYYEAWHRVPMELFEDLTTKRVYERALIDTGALRQIVKSGADPGKFGLAQLHCYRSLSSLPNARAVLGAWLQPFVPVKMNISKMSPSEEHDKHLSVWVPPVKAVKRHQAFENVNKQKQGIISLLRTDDYVNLRKYASHLVASQLPVGGADLAAKSLCDLAQHAKRLSKYSLQLEWAKWAADIAPGDAWAHGQVADAYFCLGQYDNARKWFDATAALGHVAFATTGHARVLRAQGRLEQSLAEYKKVVDEFADQMPAWVGYAEVLREMWRLDDALEAYNQAIAKFLDYPMPHNGRAAVLRDLGQLDEALEAYQSIIDKFGDDAVAYAGRADVLKEMGRLDESLAAYDDTVRMFPDANVPYNGRADVLKEMGRFEDSLQEYQNAIKMFPYDPVAYCGRADVLKEAGRFADALKAFGDAAERFPHDSRIRNGRASLLKRQARFEDALQAYDQNVKDFPYDLYALSGRADLLKELGYLQDAIRAYDRVIARAPRDRHAYFAKAAIFAAMGRFGEAEALLPRNNPRTRAEWVAYHIRGMVLLRSGKIDEATELFAEGLATNPFANERKYFANALVVATMRRQQFREALRFLGDDQAPVTNVLRMHVFGATNRLREAQEAFNQLLDTCPPPLVELRDELASRYRIGAYRGFRGWDWVFEQECHNLLLAA